MFGYVKPLQGELKVKEYEFYKAAYCGLCRALKQKSRILPFTLSYDFVFLAILRMAVAKEKPEIRKIRCIAHPFRKNKPALALTPSLERTASAAALLVYYNLKDDVADKKGIRKLGAAALLPLTGRVRKKNVGDGLLDSVIADALALISRDEKAEAKSPYACAETFGILLGTVFADGTEGETKKSLFQIGRRVGRWIYLLDAADDAEKDAKKKNYNPFVLGGDYLRPDFAENMELALNCELAVAAEELEKLNITDPGLLNILQNILYLGMPAVAERVLTGSNCHCDAEKKEDDPIDR